MTDRNFASYADADGVIVEGDLFAPDASGLYADVLKFSCLRNSVFRDIVVTAGDAKENAIDANRKCYNVLVSGASLSGGRQAAIVVKGGCLGMVFDRVRITPHPDSWCDVLWDDWSDQSTQASTGTLRDVRRTDGLPLRVVFGRFKRPTINSPYRILWPQTVGLHFYNIGKGLLRLLHLA